MPDLHRTALTAAALACACGPEAEPPAAAGPAWEVQYADSSARFIALSVVDARTVWVGGAPGLVGRTTDGGATWVVATVSGADSLQFRDVHAFSDAEAFALTIGPGEASRIYHTADGGATWTLSFRNDDPDAFFDCFSFWDRERGFAFSDSHDGEFTLIRTADGGASWERIAPALVPDARPGEGAFAASGTCVTTRPGGLGWFATGASGVDTRVMRTADYGAHWEEAPTPIASTDGTSGIFSVAFRDDLHGVAAGGNDARRDSVFDDVAVTEDGGVTWTPAGRTGLGGAVYGVAWVPGAPTPTLVAVSPAGSAWSVDGGATWRRVDAGNYWTVAFHGPDAGWGAGAGHISRLRGVASGGGDGPR